MFKGIGKKMKRKRVEGRMKKRKGWFKGEEDKRQSEKIGKIK